MVAGALARCWCSPRGKHAALVPGTSTSSHSDDGTQLSQRTLARGLIIGGIENVTSPVCPASRPRILWPFGPQSPRCGRGSGPSCSCPQILPIGKTSGNRPSLAGSRFATTRTTSRTGVMKCLICPVCSARGPEPAILLPQYQFFPEVPPPLCWYLQRL
jgi:hypothetical protein